jgi:DNA gyrase subunit A
MIPVKEYKEDEYLFMATKNGIVKKTNLSEYANIRKNGLAAINLREDDLLIEVKMAKEDDEAMLFTKFGMAIRFKVSDVRTTGRTSIGVIGMSLSDQDDVIAMQLTKQGESVMIVSSKGLGKCTLISEFTTQRRGGKGVKCYKIMEKTGNVVGVKAVSKEDEVMLINTEGTVIRMKVADTTLLSRITSGVKLIDLKDDETVASIAKVRQEDIIEEEIEEEEAETSGNDTTEE